MPDFVAALDQAISSSLCRMMDGLGDALWTWGQGTGSGPGSYLVNPASFIYRKFCNDEPAPAPSPPFEGGQCCDQFYSFTWEVDQGDRGLATGTAGRDMGKITGQYRIGPNTGFNTYMVEFARESCAGELSWTFVGFFQGPNGGPPLSAAVTGVIPDNPAADICGNVEPEPPSLPNQWNIDNTNITYTNKDGLDLTIPLVFAWGYADLDFNANFRIPFTLRLGDSTNNNQSIFKGSLNVNTGDITYRPLTNYYGYPGPGSGPGDGNPDSNLPEYPSIDLPEQPPITPEEESGKEPKLIAAIVTVVSLSSGSIGEIFQEENPNIKIPNLGYINFFHRTGKISGAWSEDIPIKNTRQYVPVPFNGNVIDVRGTPRLGVTWVITPVFDTKQSDPQIPNESLVITGV